MQSNALTPVRKLNAAENAANMQNCEVETHRTLLCLTNTATQIVPYKTLLAMLCLTKHSQTGGVAANTPIKIVPYKVSLARSC